MPIPGYKRALLSACLLFVTASVGYSSAQSSNEEQAPLKPKNLKVLPKDSSLADVYKTMLSMQRDLGVQCGFCHEEDSDTKKIDYASDENPRKEMARAMLRMTSDINEKYLGTLGTSQYSAPVTCGSCHLGQMHPPAFDPSGGK